MGAGFNTVQSHAGLHALSCNDRSGSQEAGKARVARHHRAGPGTRARPLTVPRPQGSRFRRPWRRGRALRRSRSWMGLDGSSPGPLQSGPGTLPTGWRCRCDTGLCVTICCRRMRGWKFLAFRQPCGRLAARPLTRSRPAALCLVARATVQPCNARRAEAAEGLPVFRRDRARCAARAEGPTQSGRSCRRCRSFQASRPAASAAPRMPVTISARMTSGGSNGAEAVVWPTATLRDDAE